jgi:excisionase family DNA binding protein
MDRAELELLTTSEAAALLKISRRKIYNLDLPRVKIGRLTRWRLQDIERLVEANTHYPPRAFPRAHNPELRDHERLESGLSLWESAKRLNAMRAGREEKARKRAETRKP